MSQTQTAVPAPYLLRPGVYGDAPAWGRLYYVSFTDPRSPDNIVDALFPDWRDKPGALQRMMTALFAQRHWSLEYGMTSLVDGSSGEVVGFSCWKRPGGDISFAERWLYPSTWFSYLMQTLISVRYRLTPGPKIDPTNLGHFVRVMGRIEPQFLNSPRRRDAMYLSTAAVDPALQGRGLGLALMNEGLAKCETAAAAAAAAAADDEGVNKGDGNGDRACWLVARLGTERFYERFGFVKVADSAVDEVSHWNGGAVMFRE